jgi:hypothetical protein
MTSARREPPPGDIEPRRRRRARERTSLPNRSGSPRTERSASHSQSSVSRTRGRYFSNPPHLRIAEGDTSVDPRGVPEAKQTHFRKLARYEKSEGGTFGTPEGFQKHLAGTFGTPEGFQKPKPDTSCNPRGCKKYLPRTSRTPDSLEKSEADAFGQLRLPRGVTASRSRARRSEWRPLSAPSTRHAESRGDPARSHGWW